MSTEIKIVSLVTTDYLPEFTLLYHSFRRFHDNEIILIDGGLTLEAVNAINNMVGLTIIKPDFVALPKFLNHNIVWLKPFYFDLLPRDQDYLWLDADTVITSAIEEAFAAAKEKFNVYRDDFDLAASLNDRRLYAALGIDIRPEMERLSINAGVMGFNPKRDIAILTQIKEYVMAAATDSTLQSFITGHDRGCVLAAIHKLRLYYNVLDCDKINVKPRLIMGNQHGSRDEAIIDHLTESNVGKCLIHFAGPVKASILRIRHADYNHRLDDYPTIIRNDSRAILLTGLLRRQVGTIAEALVRAGPHTSSHHVFDDDDLAYSVYYGRYKSQGIGVQVIDHAKRIRSSRLDVGDLNVISGHNLIYKLDDLVKDDRLEVVCVLPTLHDYILYSLEEFDIFGDSLDKYGQDYVEAYRSGRILKSANLLKIHDKRCEHILDNYIKSYVDVVGTLNRLEIMPYVIDDHRYLYRLPNILGLEEMIDKVRYNQIISTYLKPVGDYARREYIRLMRSYEELPRHIGSCQLPPYKVL